MQLMVALAPLHRAAGIQRINIATYQSVSGTGRRALEELGRQTAGLLNFQSVEPEVYPVQIAFNVIPHGGDFDTNGYTSEEMKLVHETRKILGDATIRSEEHTSELQSLMRISYAVFCLKKKKPTAITSNTTRQQDDEL